MLNNENRCIVILSTLFVGFILYIGKPIDIYLYFYILIIPLYFIVVILIDRASNSREKVDLAVACCVEESEFNVIDKIEQLRMHFKNTADVIEYLTVVESRVLAYVFNKNNIKLKHREYVSGAVRCLATFKGYTGSYYLNVDNLNLEDNDRVSVLISTLYMISKQMDSGSASIYILSRQIDDGVILDVVDRYQSSVKDDLFCKKLLQMFSTREFALTAKAV